jgi:hypothetical protein
VGLANHHHRHKYHSKSKKNKSNTHSLTMAAKESRSVTKGETEGRMMCGATPTSPLVMLAVVSNVLANTGLILDKTKNNALSKMLYNAHTLGAQYA